MGDSRRKSSHNLFSGTARGPVLQARDIYGNILITDQALPIPRQLPADINDFVGRRSELRLMQRALRAERPSKVIIIDGTPGIGKTALGLRWAHSVSGKFPDGQLFIDMHRFDARPEKVDAREVLEQFLRSLNVSERKVPKSLGGRSALFRSIIANRKILIMVDNVAEAEDLRPLIPAGQDCCAIATSRNSIPELSALGDIERIHLGPLSTKESLLLVRKRIGTDVVDSNPHEFREVITISGHLPLALRIVSQRLRLIDSSAITEAVDRLATTSRVLDEFRVGKDPSADMRSIIAWSYSALPENAAHVFRMASIHIGSTMPSGALEALSGLPADICHNAVTSLIDANLIDVAEPNRYYQHELLRSFGREQVATNLKDGEHRTALRQLLVWYAFAVDAADRVLEPQRRHADLTEYVCRGSIPSFDSPIEALSWCDAERKNIVAAVSAASDMAMPEISWKLAVSFWSYLDMRKYWDDWINVHLIGASAARAANDVYGEAWVLNGLGIAYFELRQYPDAVAAWQEAVSLRRQIADKLGAGWAINNLGNLRFETGELRMAEQCWEEAMELFRQSDHRQGVGVAISNIGRIHAREGRINEAIACQRQAIAIFEVIQDKRNMGFALNNLAEALTLSGDNSNAVSLYREALSIRRDVQDRRGVARTLYGLGTALLQVGQVHGSAEALIESERLFDELADPAVENVRELLTEFSINLRNREGAMDPVTIEVVIAAMSAAAAGIGTEAGKSAWSSLTSVVKRTFGPHSAEARILDQLPGSPINHPSVISLAAGLIARSKEDPEIANELGAFLGLLQEAATQGTGFSNTVSGSAVIRGGLVQGRDFAGPITFSGEAADGAPHPLDERS